MSRCEKCGAKDHSTLAHESAMLAAVTRESVPPGGSYMLEALLPFEREQSPTTLVAAPQKPFLPLGLMLWDVGLLNVSAVLVGRDLQLVCSFGNVPARWFNVQKSFEAMALAQSAGDAVAWGHWTPAYPGQLVRLHFDGPCDRVQALMWGRTP